MNREIALLTVVVSTLAFRGSVGAWISSHSAPVSSVVEEEGEDVEEVAEQTLAVLRARVKLQSLDVMPLFKVSPSFKFCSSAN